MPFESDEQRRAYFAQRGSNKVSSNGISHGTAVNGIRTTSNKMMMSTPQDMIGMALTNIMSKASAKKMEILFENKAVKNLEPYSQEQLKDILTDLDYQWDTAITSWNWEDIIKRGTKRRELYDLKNTVSQIAMDNVDKAFGFEEPEPRPITKAEKSQRKLLEPFENMRDESLGILGESRNVDYKLVKEIINDYLAYLDEVTIQEMPRRFL